MFLFPRSYLLKNGCGVFCKDLSCYRFAEHLETVTGKLRPECKYVEDNFTLLPIKEFSFKNKGYFCYRIPANVIKIGFYYLKEKPNRKKSLFLYVFFIEELLKFIKHSFLASAVFYTNSIKANGKFFI